MPRAIRIHETGGPEVMRLEEVAVPAPDEGEVQLRHTAIGLNYIDVYDRTGHYPQPLPAGLGREGAGVVAAIGRKVRGFRIGDRVAYVSSKPGSYCEVRNVPASRLVKIPAGVTDEHYDRAIGFGYRDRVTVAVIIRHAGGHDFGGLRHAGAERGRKAEQGAKHVQGLAAMKRNSRCHGSALVPTR